jgi:GntP family gluconate:H+ symporter
VLLGFLVSVVFRISQGSATVAMQTTSAMFIALLPNLPCHPLYLFLAIGFGATGFSWMNDSGFWVVSRLSGFTEKETLKTWSVLLSVIALVGITMTLILSMVMPLK